MRVHVTQFIFPLSCMALAGFLAWTAMNGERGQKRLSERQETFVKLVQSLADEAESRDALARRVNLMRSGNLDPDMLDERARKMLEFSHKNDVIVLLNR
ncbi:MAG: FtsB family cell division protein [Hyphomicrobiales bacterium]